MLSGWGIDTKDPASNIFVFFSLYLLLGGLIAGHFLFYIYYALFRYYLNRAGNKKRRGINRIERALDGWFESAESKDYAKTSLAVHQLSMAREKTRIFDEIRFGFSVFHSIGCILLAVWFGWSASLVINGLMFAWNQTVLSWQICSFAVMFILSILFVSEYLYRTRIVFEIENHLLTLHLPEVIDELDSGQRKIKALTEQKKSQLKSKRA
jgi:hypothetical protein